VAGLAIEIKGREVLIDEATLPLISEAFTLRDPGGGRPG
jgi:hypothetical protein